MVDVFLLVFVERLLQKLRLAARGHVDNLSRILVRFPRTRVYFRNFVANRLLAKLKMVTVSHKFATAATIRCDIHRIATDSPGIA